MLIINSKLNYVHGGYETKGHSKYKSSNPIQTNLMKNLRPRASPNANGKRNQGLLKGLMVPLPREPVNCNNFLSAQTPNSPKKISG